MLAPTQPAKPHTIRLLHACLRIGEMAAIHYKYKFLRPRPSVLCPALQPPMGPPGHPSFPSGHSLQGHLVSAWLQELSGGAASQYTLQLDWLADRIAINRATKIFDVMLAIEAGLTDPWLRTDPVAPPPGPLRMIEDMITDARTEW